LRIQPSGPRGPVYDGGRRCWRRSCSRRAPPTARPMAADSWHQWPRIFDRITAQLLFQHLFRDHLSPATAAAVLVSNKLNSPLDMDDTPAIDSRDARNGVPASMGRVCGRCPRRGHAADGAGERQGPPPLPRARGRGALLPGGGALILCISLPRGMDWSQSSPFLCMAVFAHNGVKSKKVEVFCNVASESCPRSSSQKTRLHFLPPRIAEPIVWVRLCKGAKGEGGPTKHSWVRPMREGPRGRRPQRRRRRTTAGGAQPPGALPHHPCSPSHNPNPRSEVCF